MVRPGLAFVSVLFLAAPAVADEPSVTPTTEKEILEASPVPPDALEDAVQEALFASHMFDGDRERALGHLSDAARSYAAALKVRKDPLAAGRLGVLLVKLGQPVEAADLLLEAIQRADAAPPKERQGFLKAYDAARAEMTWVDVTISHAGATLLLDNKPRNLQKFSALAMFVEPGQHELRAHLEGYEPAISNFRAIKGQQIVITLTLIPLTKMPEPPTILQRDRPGGPSKKEATQSSSSPWADRSRYEEKDGSGKGEVRKGTRVSIGGGPIVVFGVASWMPAVGATVGLHFQINQFVSLGGEGRAAWLVAEVADRPITAMTAGGLFSACGHYRWFFGCGLGHLGVISVDGAETSYDDTSIVFVKPGFGGRAGAKLDITQSFFLQAGVDILVLTSRTNVAAGKTVLVDQAPVMIGASISGGWEL